MFDAAFTDAPGFIQVNTLIRMLLIRKMSFDVAVSGTLFFHFKN